MRTRDEVLLGFGFPLFTEKDIDAAIYSMADRIRELEQERHEDEGVVSVWRGRTERAEQRIRELEARVDDEQKYVVTLHRMIEAHCRGERVSNSDSPHIAAMLNENLSEAASEPVAITDAMVEAADRYASNEINDWLRLWELSRDNWRDILTAALTAASKEASA